MQNLLILFNPYYQKDVIDIHLKVLLERGQVAFGKIRSKLRDKENPFDDKLTEIYKGVSETNYLQLFLTDYANIYVAKVVAIDKIKHAKITPAYYDEKSLEVEDWFIIKDLRELVYNDFVQTRDVFLANFTTPNHGGHTYAVYGNSYVYPLIVDMKSEINYFDNEDSNFRYFPNMYKSAKFLEIKQNLIDYSFGERYIHLLHPDSISNIVSAEIEFQDNKDDNTYDFNSIVIKYSKTMEQELYLFAKVMFNFLTNLEPSLKSIDYKVQSEHFTLPDLQFSKPNLGTYSFLFKNTNIKDAINNHLSKKVTLFIYIKLIGFINVLKGVRNESVHAKSANKEQAELLRNKIIGVAEESMLIELTKIRVNELKGIKQAAS
ncbi:HP0729 family protein [Helicobacter sp. 11S02629-2]|uniref:HP0729 family protein n=1 Tax=Helicobacter sp. 11S02629-2 TaxID=1476195 RepID=UPI000BA76FE5|nr:HP0729 family protein [Helicobacter sp. 11S02629-2]PAF45526.1 hypothetical protein BKH40_03435 [Helicobacter sp. 11S02629-2]